MGAESESFYWRVELGLGGQHVSCRRVDLSASTQGGQVFIVRASDEVEAYKAAKKAQLNGFLRKQRLERQAMGLCTKCGGERDCALAQCKRCRERNSFDAKMARRALKPVPPLAPTVSGLPPGKPLPPVVAPLPHPMMTRLKLLEEVNRAWLEAHNVGKFAKWLKTEIEKLTDPQKRVVSG